MFVAGAEQNFIFIDRVLRLVERWEILEMVTHCPSVVVAHPTRTECYPNAGPYPVSLPERRGGS